MRSIVCEATADRVSERLSDMGQADHRAQSSLLQPPSAPSLSLLGTKIEELSPLGLRI